MSIDSKAIGVLATQLMERLEQAFDDEIEHKVTTVMIVAEVDHHEQPMVASNEGRRWVQCAFLQEARFAVEDDMMTAALEDEAE